MCGGCENDCYGRILQEEMHPWSSGNRKISIEFCRDDELVFRIYKTLMWIFVIFTLPNHEKSSSQNTRGPMETRLHFSQKNIRKSKLIELVVSYVIQFIFLENTSYINIKTIYFFMWKNIFYLTLHLIVP